MTFPIYCALHLAYGALMTFAVWRRMRSEGEVLGVPLLWTLLPVGLFSAPVGAVLLRFSGRWFLHGALHGDGAIGFERWHLGLMFAVGLAAGLSAVVGMFFAVAFLSRDRPRAALAPVAAAAVIAGLVVLFDPQGVFVVAGTGGRTVLTHPVGLVSLANVLVLAAAWAFAARRLSTPVRVRA